jgi:hypothetical protein
MLQKVFCTYPSKIFIVTEDDKNCAKAQITYANVLAVNNARSLHVK